MALQLPPYRAYAGNPHGLVVQVTLSMSAPILFMTNYAGLDTIFA